MSAHALRRSVLSLAAGVVALPAIAQAAPAAAPIDTGDTAWMLVSTAFVLMMTIPGLALFYGGMVRKKNVLATLIQSFMICCIGSLVWMVAGYSLAFSTGSPWIGDLSRVLLRGWRTTSMRVLIPPSRLAPGRLPPSR